jgi:hypothetical protein
MKVIFDSVAVVDERSEAVRFAGRYMDPHKGERHAIIRVSGEALARYCNVSDPTPETLLAGYGSIRDRIDEVARRKVIAGEVRPTIE